MFLFVFVMLNTMSVFAGPSRTTYQARIVKPDGHALEATNVNFQFTILDPLGSCVLYSESFSAVNMGSSAGLVSFGLGSGVRTFPVSGSTFEQVFSNTTASLTCDAGGPATYSPLPTDTRRIVMQFNDGAGWQTLPAMTINAVPYAMYANDAQKFNGRDITDFVQVASLPSCGVSEAVRFNGVGFSCVAVGGAGGSVTSGSVITALGYTPANSASFTTVISDLNSVSSTLSSVSSTVFSVSSTVASLTGSISSLQSTVAASFAALTGSQWVTSGTSIHYTSGNVGIGTSAPAFPLEVAGDLAVWGPGLNGSAVQKFAMKSNATGGWLEVPRDGSNNKLNFSVNWRGGGTPGLFINGASMTVGIGHIAPMAALDVSGAIRISYHDTCGASYAGTIRYNLGAVEYCNGTSWAAFGVSGAGLTLLNGSASNTQTFANGFTGNFPNYVTANGVHTLNIPYASVGTTTAGLISYTDYLNFSNKLNATSSAVISALSYTPANSVSVTTLSSTVASLSATTAASFTALSSSVSAITSSQWVTSGTDIYYNTGNVGIGTSSPAALLDVNSPGNSGVRIGFNAPAYGVAIDYNGGAGWAREYGFSYAGSKVGSFGMNTSVSTPSYIYINANQGGANTGHGSPHLVVTASGSVGIGTTTPVTALDVVGNIRVSPTAGSAAHIELGNMTYGALNPGFSTATGGYIVGPSNASLVMDLRNNQPDDSFALRYSASNTGVVDSIGLTMKGTGRIGIGTSDPSARLEISDRESAWGNPRLLITNTSTADQVFLGTRAVSTTYPYDFQFAGIGATGSMIIRDQLTGTNRIILNRGSSGSVLIQPTAGNVGIGHSIPTAALHVKAGTSQTAPVKLTTGTLLSTPENGAIEYDGTNLYYTDSGNNRRTIAANSAAGTYDAVNTVANSSGNISLYPNSGNGSVIVSATTVSTNSQTGALVVQGGLGVAGNSNFGGNVTVSGTVRSSYTHINAASLGQNQNDTVEMQRWESHNGNIGYLDVRHIRTTSGTNWFSAGTRIQQKTDATWSGYLQFSGTGNEHGLSFGTGSTTIAPGNTTERMRITNTGNIGIGTSAPVTTLHIVSNQPAAALHPDRAGLVLEAEGTSVGGRIAAKVYSDTENPLFVAYRSRGSKANPTALQSGDLITAISPVGYDGANWQTGAHIRFQTSENWNANSIGSTITFRTPSNATSTTLERVRIENSGYVGIGTATPTGVLDVNGGSAAANTNGTDITLAAQSASSGNRNGGHVNLIPGAPTGTGSRGSVRVGSGSFYNAAHLEISSGAPGLAINNTGNSQILLNHAGGGWGVIGNNAAGIWSLGYANTSSTNLDGSVLTWTNAGRVGVGVSAPAYTFHATKSFNGISSQSAAFIGGTDAGHANSGIYVMEKDNMALSSANSYVLKAVVNDVPKFVVNGLGNVGIGTVSAPVTNLQIRGGASYGALMLGSNGGTTNHHLTHENDGSFGIFTGTFGSGVRQMAITSGGLVGIGTSNPQEKLHVDATTSGRISISTGSVLTNSGYGVSLESDTDDGIGYLNIHTATLGSNRAAFQIRGGHGASENASARALMTMETDTGYVGIGTIDPTTTLHVAGTPRIVDGNQAAGRVLASDANGNAAWKQAIITKTGSLAANSSTTTSQRVSAGYTLTLPPGRWKIEGKGITTQASCRADFGIRTTADVVVKYSLFPPSNGDFQTASAFAYVDIATTTSYELYISSRSACTSQIHTDPALWEFVATGVAY